MPLLDIDQMTEEDVKTHFITPAIQRRGWTDYMSNEGVEVYLDESLKRHEIVYPAVGSDHSGVRLTIEELEMCSGYKDWVDVCKE